MWWNLLKPGLFDWPVAFMSFILEVTSDVWLAQAGKDQMGNDGHNLWGDFPFTKEHFKEIIPNF